MNPTLFRPTIELKTSQLRVKTELYNKIREGQQRILIVAPCAWGKTIFAASIMADAIKKGKKCLFIVHAEVLINQTIKALDYFGLNSGILAGSYKEHRSADVQVATVQALSARTKKGLDIWFQPDVVIVDEAHESAMWSKWTQKKFPKLEEGEIAPSSGFLSPLLQTMGLSTFTFPTWQELSKAHKETCLLNHPDHGGSEEIMKKINSDWEKLKTHRHRFIDVKTHDSINLSTAYNAILIGLTGSPFRLKKSETMGDFFQSQVLAPTPQEMINDGQLTPCVYYGLKSIKTEGVKITSLGDYNTQQLTTNAEIVVNDLISNYQHYCPQRTFIAFACSIQHAELIVKAFTYKGIKVKIVTGNTDPIKERPQIYKELRNHEIQGIVSVDCLTTGFDVTNISCILLARPTKSKSLYIQMIGRGMRTHDGKENCIVLDQSNNVKKYGFIENLTYPDLNKSTQQNTAPLKECPKCHRLVPISADVCECGYVWEEKDKKESSPKPLAVGKMTLLLTEKQLPYFRYYRGKILQLYHQGRNPGYAVYATQDKFNSKDLPKLWIPKEWGLGAIFGEHPKAKDKITYWIFLQKIKREQNKTQDWVDLLMAIEFGNFKD